MAAPPFAIRDRVFFGGTVALPRGFRLSPFYDLQLRFALQRHRGSGLGRRLTVQRPARVRHQSCRFLPVPYAWPATMFSTTRPSDQIPVNYLTGPSQFTLNLRLSKTSASALRLEKVAQARRGGPGGGPGGPGGPGGGGRWRRRWRQCRLWRAPRRLRRSRDHQALQPHFQRQRAQRPEQSERRHSYRSAEFAEFRTVVASCRRPVLQRRRQPQDRTASPQLQLCMISFHSVDHPALPLEAGERLCHN
jgi:hypothetical protein